ncbi:JM159 [macacine gammaherpesvirus 11]|uniref:JM159 n=2 Tax=macacine gammaherpesvirus 11 TaxID=2560570 RepID=G9JMG6_9GAMA|nr:JM159 [Macaca fuscata rhadinovirus]AAT00136.1 JM159 [Macaca fuscata rhadinovirus]AEW87683.1 JM159 [Macaca fuscata rhadinovirus]AEW87853.1 JM159 [Macaca fuscata rhadinovirus]
MSDQARGVSEVFGIHRRYVAATHDQGCSVGSGKHFGFAAQLGWHAGPVNRRCGTGLGPTDKLRRVNWGVKRDGHGQGDVNRQAGGSRQLSHSKRVKDTQVAPLVLHSGIKKLQGCSGQLVFGDVNPTGERGLNHRARFGTICGHVNGARRFLFLPGNDKNVVGCC